MPNLYLPVLASILSIILIVIYYSKKRISLLENKLYSVMLFSILFDSLLVSLLFFNVYTNYNEELVMLLNKIDYLFLIIWASSLLIYTYTITYNRKENFKRKFSIFLILVIISNIIMYVVVISSNINIIVLDQLRQTAQGPAVNISITTCLVNVFAALIIVILNIKSINKKHFPVFVIMIISIIIAFIFSFNPFLICISIGLTIVNLIMYFTIENPDLSLINQLELAKDQAEKANKAKTDFLSSMSHEIRTPLNAIVGFSECVLDATSLDEAKEDSKNVVMASQNLLEIVNGILDISKIEANKMEIVNKEYDFKETLDALTKLAQVRIGEKDLVLQTQFAPDLPNTLYGDCGKLKQIITNLLTNAVKYTESGIIEFRVNCINKKNVSNLVISVSDTGRGIKPENIDKLFTKFQRLDEDKNTTTEGTGLGLAITKRLVELMGGTITVQSKYQSGSNFTVCLSQEIRTTLYKKEVIEEETDYEHMKVLVVDDNSLNIKVADKIFKAYGIDIIGITSGFECIEKIKNNGKFDVIFMDIMMPKMDGVETLSELKKIDGFNIPVVALTADAMDGKEDKYVSSGFVSYLSKPIDRERLKQVLNKYGKVKEEIKENNILDERVSYLKKNGINVDKALELLGDVNMYNATLNDFISVLDSRLSKINNYKENKDMKNYAIEVHSLKSDCKYLGFDKLADISYNHELKSKNNDVNYINENYQKLTDEVSNIRNIVEKYLKSL